MGKRPENHLAKAIIATCLCCFPLGIVAIVNAAKVDSAFDRGDFEEAQRLSDEAGKWANISLWLGIAGWIIYVIALITYFVLLACGIIPLN